MLVYAQMLIFLLSVFGIPNNLRGMEQGDQHYVVQVRAKEVAEQAGVIAAQNQQGLPQPQKVKKKSRCCCIGKALTLFLGGCAIGFVAGVGVDVGGRVNPVLAMCGQAIEEVRILKGYAANLSSNAVQLQAGLQDNAAIAQSALSACARIFPSSGNRTTG